MHGEVRREFMIKTMIVLRNFSRDKKEIEYFRFILEIQFKIHLSIRKKTKRN